MGPLNSKTTGRLLLASALVLVISLALFWVLFGLPNLLCRERVPSHGLDRAHPGRLTCRFLVEDPHDGDNTIAAVELTNGGTTPVSIKSYGTLLEHLHMQIRNPETGEAETWRGCFSEHLSKGGGNGFLTIFEPGGNYTFPLSICGILPPANGGKGTREIRFVWECDGSQVMSNLITVSYTGTKQPNRLRGKHPYVIRGLRDVHLPPNREEEESLSLSSFAMRFLKYLRRSLYATVPSPQSG